MEDALRRRRRCPSRSCPRSRSRGRDRGAPSARASSVSARDERDGDRRPRGPLLSKQASRTDCATAKRRRLRPSPSRRTRATSGAEKSSSSSNRKAKTAWSGPIATTRTASTCSSAAPWIQLLDHARMLHAAVASGARAIGRGSWSRSASADTRARAFEAGCGALLSLGRSSTRRRVTMAARLPGRAASGPVQAAASARYAAIAGACSVRSRRARPRGCGRSRRCRRADRSDGPSCSGEMKPRELAGRLADLLAVPKSVRIAAFVRERITFAGFTSWCTQPAVA